MIGSPDRSQRLAWMVLLCAVLVGSVEMLWLTPPTAVAQSNDPELDARRKKATAEQEQKQKVEQEKDAAQRADNCARAKSHLSALSDGLRIARTNDKGEREILDDKGRAEEMQRARQTIASDCK